MLAHQVQADAVVLDDATARRVAVQEGCAVVGLLGLLVDGKRRGLIPAIKPLLDALREARFLSPMTCMPPCFGKLAKSLSSTNQEHLTLFAFTPSSIPAH